MENLKQVVIEKLCSDNYGTWSFKMKALLCGLDVWEAVITDCPAEEKDGATVKNAKDISAWKRMDGKAFSQIVLSVDNSQIGLVKKAESAKVAWQNLKEYHQKSSVCTMGLILRKIHDLRLSEGGNAEQHLFEMEELFDKLGALGLELQETLKVVTILQSLPESYRALGTALEARPIADLTLSIMKAKVLDEYQKVKSSRENSEVALKVDTKSFTCNYCKKPGHIQRNCWILNAKQSDSGGDSSHKEPKTRELQKESRPKNYARMCINTENTEKPVVVKEADFSF